MLQWQLLGSWSGPVGCCRSKVSLTRDLVDLLLARLPLIVDVFVAEFTGARFIAEDTPLGTVIAAYPRYRHFRNLECAAIRIGDKSALTNNGLSCFAGALLQSRYTPSPLQPPDRHDVFQMVQMPNRIAFASKGDARSSSAVIEAPKDFLRVDRSFL